MSAGTVVAGLAILMALFLLGGMLAGWRKDLRARVEKARAEEEERERERRAEAARRFQEASDKLLQEIFRNYERPLWQQYSWQPPSSRRRPPFGGIGFGIDEILKGLAEQERLAAERIRFRQQQSAAQARMQHRPARPSWWEVLGCEKNAPADAVRAAYKAAAKRTHPDRPSGSAEAFRAVTEAYQEAMRTRVH